MTKGVAKGVAKGVTKGYTKGVTKGVRIQCDYGKNFEFVFTRAEYQRTRDYRNWRDWGDWNKGPGTTFVPVVVTPG